MTQVSSKEPTTIQRYVQLGVIVVAAGPIYPLVYLRQNFEVTILESFGITASQLGQCYALLGVLYVVTYLPSGWLADRVPTRYLMSFSLAAAGFLGVWFSTMPSFLELKIIFVGWGLTTGLTFWSAIIKATAILAKPKEQGRFFGILDGGRGLVEAVLATAAIGLFAYSIDGLGQSNLKALQSVIWFYVACMFVMSPIVLFSVRNYDLPKPKNSDPPPSNLLKDLRTILIREEIWLCAFCILTGYQLFWATYSFSAYLQTQYGLTAVAVGTITVAKLWMRPLGAAAAGFAGDFMDREWVLAGLLLAASVSLGGIVMLPQGSNTFVLLGIVLLVGFLTYAVRGIFWATLESCNIHNAIKGLAIGVISLIGYSPDVYLPLINGALLERYPGKTGYALYFSGIAVFGVLGALAAWRLKWIVAKNHPPSTPRRSMVHSSGGDQP